MPPGNNAASYDIARKGLEAAVENPDAFSEDDIRRLSDIVRNFQDTSIKLQAPPPSSLGEGGSTLGPTGMDMLERKIPEQQPPERFTLPDILDAALHPGATAPLKTEFANTVIPDETPQERNDRLVEYKSKYFDDTLPNASGRKDFTALPEHLPPAPNDPAITNPIEAFGLKLSNARAAMPGVLGGKVEHYLEPSIEQFQRDMYPTLGPKVLNMDHSNNAYKEYADGRWQPIYEKAVKENRPVVRDAYKTDKSWQARVTTGLDETAGMAMSAVSGVAEALPFGGQATRGIARAVGGEDAVENMKNLQEGSPIAGGVGRFAGGFQKNALANIFGGIAGGALPEVAGFGANVARSGLQGGAVGAGAAAAQDINEGKLPTDESMSTGALFALPLAMIGGGIGYGARAHGENLRTTTGLGQAERAGTAKTSTLFGVSPTEEANAIRRDSYTRTGGIGREVDVLALDRVPRLLEGGQKLTEATKQELGAVQSQYFAAVGEMKKPVTPMLKEAMRLHATGKSRDGRALPLHKQQSHFLQEAIEQSSSTGIEPASGGRANVRSTNGDAFDLSPEEAMQQGVNVDKAMQSYMKSGNDAPGDFVVRVTPRRLTAPETESIIDKVGDYLDQGDADKKRALISLMPFSRQVRDQFPAAGPISPDLSARVGDTELKGWSAFQHQASERIAENRKTLEDAGLPGGKKLPARLDSNQQKAAENAIRGYGQPGRSPDLDQALRDLADPQKLEQIRGMVALPSLESQSSIFPSMSQSGIRGGFNPKGARFHLDPFLEAIAPPLMSGRSGSAGGLLGREKKPLPQQLDQATLDKLRALYGPGGPF